MSSNIPGRPFTDLLGEMENGEVLHDLTEEVYNVTAAVVDTRKPGKITLTVDVIPTTSGTVALVAKVATKVPEHSRPQTTFFVGDDLSLHRDDPRQERLKLREVEKPTTLRNAGE